MAALISIISSVSLFFIILPFVLFKNIFYLLTMSNTNSTNGGDRLERPKTLDLSKVGTRKKKELTKLFSSQVPQSASQRSSPVPIPGPSLNSVSMNSEPLSSTQSTTPMSLPPTPNVDFSINDPISPISSDGSYLNSPAPCITPETPGSQFRSPITTITPFGSPGVYPRPQFSANNFSPNRFRSPPSSPMSTSKSPYTPDSNFSYTMYLDK